MFKIAKIGMKASYSYNEFDGKGTVYGFVTEAKEDDHIIMTDFENEITYCIAPDLLDEDHIFKLYDKKGAVIYNSNK